MNTSHPILIIGAGLAGLSAAAELNRLGHRPLVLEASNRIGGRLRTDRSAGFPMELGAQVLHSSKRNPLVALTARRGFKPVPARLPFSRLYRNGKPLPDSEADKFEDRFDGILAKAFQRGGSRQTSVLEAMEKCGLRKAFSGAEDVLESLLSGAGVYSGESLGRLSIRYFEDAEEYGQPARFVPAGLDKITAILLEKIAAPGIRTSCPVTRIAWKNKQPGIKVTAGGKTYLTQKVLITLPLGVLKARPTLFAPALPAAKRSAIGRLGFGVLDVVYLEYPKRFWPKDRVSFGVAGEKCFPRFYDRSRFSGRPILSTGIGGDNARRLEGWSDSRIKAAAHKVLRGVFGPRIPEPTHIRVTRWSQDPLARGSYSNLPTGSSPADRAQLAQPVAGKLFFAGEATHDRDPATLHGAYLSGMREARRIAAGL